MLCSPEFLEGQPSKIIKYWLINFPTHVRIRPYLSLYKYLDRPVSFRLPAVPRLCRFTTYPTQLYIQPPFGRRLTEKANIYRPLPIASPYKTTLPTPQLGLVYLTTSSFFHKGKTRRPHELNILYPAPSPAALATSTIPGNPTHPKLYSLPRFVPPVDMEAPLPKKN